MYLYIPLDGRSIVVDSVIISATGVQFDKPIPSFDEVLGTLLRLETDEVARKTPATKVVKPVTPATPEEPIV